MDNKRVSLIGAVGIFLLLFLFDLSKVNGFNEAKRVNFLASIDSSLRPIPGRPLPDVTLKNVEYNSKVKNLRLRDFRGKWLVLDFWNKGCGTCIGSFPKMNSFAKEFSSDVQFILVGLEDKQNQIRTIYEKFRKKYNLSFTAAFDSSIMNQWKIHASPHIIVVDPSGIVRVRATSLSADNMRSYLRGESPKVALSQDFIDETMRFDRSRPFMESGNGSGSYLPQLKSIVQRWHNDLPRYNLGSLRMELLKNGQYEFRILGYPLHMLYNLCFTGKTTWFSDDSLYKTFWRFPEFSSVDSTLFDLNSFDDVGFSYSLSMDRMLTNEQVAQRMRIDLDNYFGFSTLVESREKEYWKVTVKAGSRSVLASKGGEVLVADGPMKGKFARNVPVSYLIHILSLRSGSEFRPFIDETEISGNIDFDLRDCDWTDFEDVKKHLRKIGFELKLDKKIMNVVVVRRKKDY